MNRYGDRAQKYWRDYRPDAYSQIADPKEFFTNLGKAVETQVMDLEDHIAGPDQPGEGYLGKVGRLNVAKLQAEEKIMADLVYLPAEIDPEWDEEAEQRAAAFAKEQREDLLLRRELQYRGDVASEIEDLYETAKDKHITMPTPQPSLDEIFDMPVAQLDKLHSRAMELAGVTTTSVTRLEDYDRMFGSGQMG